MTSVTQGERLETFLTLHLTNGFEYYCSCACHPIERRRPVYMCLFRHDSGYCGCTIKKINAPFETVSLDWEGESISQVLFRLQVSFEVVVSALNPLSAYLSFFFFFFFKWDVENQPCQPSSHFQVLQCPAEEVESVDHSDTYHNNHKVTVHFCSEDTKL